MLPLIEGRVSAYLQRFLCMGERSPDYLFTQLFISVYTHGYLLYILGYNPILLYFVAQIVPPLAIWSSYIWILCHFDTPPHPMTLCMCICLCLALSYFLAQ